MQKIFNDMLHKNVECYVEDVLIETNKRSDHLKDLRMVFDKLRHYNLKMNLLKCAFGVISGKFLGFIVKHRDIEVDQVKIKAIQSMLEPRKLHELKKSARATSLHQTLNLQPYRTLSTFQSTHEEIRFIHIG